MKLKYLFRAVFNDGTELSQLPDDTNPNGPGSSFTYLLDEEKKHGGIAAFSLEGEGTTASVNLKDGTFAINGVVFGAHAQDWEPTDLRLIYFREVKQHIYGGEIVGSETSRHFIGWQYTDPAGRNRQQTIFIT